MFVFAGQTIIIFKIHVVVWYENINWSTSKYKYLQYIFTF